LNASLLEMSVSSLNLLKQALKELSVEDKMTTDQWLALDAWKKLLHEKDNIGGGLDSGVRKLKKALYL
jgi:predicted nucleotidyltransferase